MRRLLQPSYECFGMHLGRFELVPVPVAPSRLPVPLALSTRLLALLVLLVLQVQRVPLVLLVLQGIGKRNFLERITA